MDKYALLKQNLAGIGRLCVCYSGGVDSALLLKAAHDALGERAFAVIADVPMLPRAELTEALALAERIGARCLALTIDALSVPELQRNDKRRCYFCKAHIFGRIREFAAGLGAVAIADGSNADDARAYRPGAQAAAELGVISPLRDAGMTKADIRACSREQGLPTWDKPANACLATRLPYDSPVTAEALRQVELTEALLHARGYQGVRARVHGDLLRVEAPAGQLALLVAERELFAEIKKLGFRYVTVDAEGFRSGSMD